MALFAVTTARGQRWDASRGIRHQAGWTAHAHWADTLLERGVILLGGPIGGELDDVALLIMAAADDVALRAILAEDPWASTGILRVKSIRPWTLWLDGRTVG